jgi:hypothetical protein
VEETSKRVIGVVGEIFLRRIKTLVNDRLSHGYASFSWIRGAGRSSGNKKAQHRFLRRRTKQALL